jgi:hypothetical protein
MQTSRRYDLLTGAISRSSTTVAYELLRDSAPALSALLRLTATAPRKDRWSNHFLGGFAFALAQTSEKGQVKSPVIPADRLSRRC